MSILDQTSRRSSRFSIESLLHVTASGDNDDGSTTNTTSVSKRESEVTSTKERIRGAAEYVGENSGFTDAISFGGGGGGGDVKTATLQPHHPSLFRLQATPLLTSTASTAAAAAAAAAVALNRHHQHLYNGLLHPLVAQINFFTRYLNHHQQQFIEHETDDGMQRHHLLHFQQPSRQVPPSFEINDAAHLSTTTTKMEIESDVDAMNNNDDDVRPEVIRDDVIRSERLDRNCDNRRRFFLQRGRFTSNAEVDQIQNDDRQRNRDEASSDGERSSPRCHLQTSSPVVVVVADTSSTTPRRTVSSTNRFVDVDDDDEEDLEKQDVKTARRRNGNAFAAKPVDGDYDGDDGRRRGNACYDDDNDDYDDDDDDDDDNNSDESDEEQIHAKDIQLLKESSRPNCNFTLFNILEIL